MHNGDQMCPRYEAAVQIIGKRWTPLIVRTLLVQPRRFTEITAIIGGLSDRLLSERLKELESCGILERRVFPETPVRIEYALTDKGRELEHVVTAIQHWADAWAEAGSAPCIEAGSAVRS
jgi:DNA-binding HxlR family transcriptional regulator